MKKPETLVRLLEELQSEGVVSDIVPLKTSKVVIYLEPNDVNEEDGLTLTGEECRLLFATPDTMERMMEALNCPEEASICLFDITLSQTFIDRIERAFVAVDEG